MAAGILAFKHTTSFGGTMRTPPPPLAIQVAALATFLSLAACGGMRTPITSESKPEQVALREAASALLLYEDLVRSQDSKAIARLFTSTGTLEHVG
jgi:hypothetical protein